MRADSLPAEASGKPKNTGVGSLSLLQWIFPTQESNQSLLHCRWILYQLSHKGSPRIPEWVAYPFSSRSSHPGIKLGSPALQVDSLPIELLGKPMYGCESWTVKKAERRRIDAFELWCWRGLLRVPWTARRSNQSILKEIDLNIHWKN